MLNIRIKLAGRAARIWRVASRPLRWGKAESIKITCGFSAPARRTASSPSLASPTTEMSGSSSSIRRKPRRTRAWSSTSRTVVLSGMSAHSRFRHSQADQRSACGGPHEFNRAAEEIRAFAHRNQPDTGLCSAANKSRAVIFHVQFQRFGQKAQANPCLPRSGMPCHIIQSFLQHAVNVDGRGAIQWKWSAGFFVTYRDTRLLFHGGNIPIHRVFESRFLQHDGMERLRKSADFVERGLRDIADFPEIRAEGRTLRRVFFRAIEHRADGREDLAELVMQFTGNVAQSRLLRGDQFLGKLASLL